MKKQFLRILLLLVMVLSLVPGMSIAASAEEAEEMSEVLAFEKGSAEVESPHFILSAGQSEYYGWFVDSGDNKIVIDAKEPNIVITSIETFVGGDGENNPDIVYSSGEKVETGAVKNGSTVHVKNINSSSLEITSSDGTIAFQTFVVRYIVSDTQSHTHNFTGRCKDNGDGTHSRKCANCNTYGEAIEHTYKPVSKVSDNPLTYTAKCTDCSSRIDNFKIDAISFIDKDWVTYSDVGVGDNLKRGAKLRAVYTFGDYDMIVYVDNVQVATVVGGQFWEVPQCVRCVDYATHWFQPWERLEIWFETVCDYTLATCDSPSVCMYCGRTVAEAPGHPWKSATCTEAKTCLDCGRTEGGPLGHSWKAATCTAPKTCARCGLTEGELIEHTYGLVDGMAKCTVCGKIFVPTIEETQISYTDRTWDGEKVAETGKEHEGIVYVDESTTIMANDNWYVVNSYVTNHNRIKVWGTANLILCDGFTLDATAGINVAEGNTLNIYAQSADSGKLIAVGSTDCAGIGGNGSGKGGTVNIYGGTVNATGGKDASYNPYDEAAGSGAGIGGGAYASGGTVTVYGGTVNATGGKLSAGIGGGYSSASGGTVTVYGGTVNATGARCGAGIGGGAGGNCGTVTINGGTVNANGGDFGAGIGGGTVSNGGTVIINSGIVNATGGFGAAGIGGANEGAAVNVNGGTVNAIAGNFAAGIGGGQYGNGGNLTVNGGTVTAISGGNNSKAIGAGFSGTEDGTVTVADTMRIRGGDNADNLAEISEVGVEKYVEITPCERTHVYTVSFDMNGHGAQVEDQTVEDGSKATKPADPTAEGWTFDGWYADSTFSAAFDFDTAINADTTIYAKWTQSITPPVPVPYTIIAGANSEWTKGSSTGLEFISDAPITKFDSVKVDGVTIAETNYIAMETVTLAPAYLETLNIGLHHIEIVYNDGSASTTFIVEAEAQPPVPETYTVSFNMNGHGTQVEAQTVEDGSKATKPADPTAEGWTFGGWYADSTFSAAFDFNTTINADTTIYAKWTQNTTPPVPTTYTINFEMNGHGAQVEDQTVEDGSKATKPADPTAEGWMFGGWYADSTFSAAFDFDTAINADTTVYAKWTQSITPPVPVPYTIIAGANGEWTKGSTTGLAFTSDAPFDKFDSVKVDGSTIAATNYTAVEGSTKITLAPAYLETLSAEGHTIEVVSKDGSASTGFTVREAVVPPAPASYTVTFIMNGHGTQVAEQTVESGSKAAKPADPKASGYTFDGWYSDAACKVQFDFNSAITADTAVYAKWTKNNPPLPPTGDNSHMFLWITLLLVSGGVFAGTSVNGKKRKRAE